MSDMWVPFPVLDSFSEANESTFHWISVVLQYMDIPVTVNSQDIFFLEIKFIANKIKDKSSPFSWYKLGSGIRAE